LSLSTKKSWGGLQEAGWTGHSTIVKFEAVEACVSIPLQHRIFHFIASHLFLKRFNFWALFSLECNERVRGLQVEVRVNFLNRLGVFLSCTPLMLSIHIGGVLKLAHPKELIEYLPNGRQGACLLIALSL
jgi:hypothetical protein